MPAGVLIGMPAGVLIVICCCALQVALAALKKLRARNVIGPASALWWCPRPMGSSLPSLRYCDSIVHYCPCCTSMQSPFFCTVYVSWTSYICLRLHVLLLLNESCTARTGLQASDFSAVNSSLPLVALGHLQVVYHSKEIQGLQSPSRTPGSGGGQH